MRFTSEGKDYSIEFSRSRREVTIYKTGDKAESKYPYTCVEIRQYGADGVYTIIATGEQGCCPNDTFSLEEGRLRALKKATLKLPLELRKPLWECYHGRVSKKKAKPTPSTPSGNSAPFIGPMMKADFKNTPVYGYVM